MKGLSLDGGGVLGVGQAEIISRVSDWTKFGFIGGVSIGAVNAAAIATDQAANWIDQFDVIMPKIFAGRWWRRYYPVGPRYNDTDLNAELRKLFPGYLKNVSVPLFILASDMERRRIKVFSSLNRDDGEYRLWEVLRMSVAAPTYFLPWNGMADGGVLANNPAIVAAAGVIDALPVKVEEIELCSIGTGECLGNANVGSTKRWTSLSWGIFLLQYLLDGAGNKMHDYFARRLPLKRYHRIQFERNEGWELDNVEGMHEARVLWENQIIQGVKDVEAF
jgi:hypothetical protein